MLKVNPILMKDLPDIKAQLENVNFEITRILYKMFVILGKIDDEKLSFLDNLTFIKSYKVEKIRVKCEHSNKIYSGEYLGKIIKSYVYICPCGQLSYDTLIGSPESDIELYLQYFNKFFNEQAS